MSGPRVLIGACGENATGLRRAESLPVPRTPNPGTRAPDQCLPHGCESATGELGRRRRTLSSVLLRAPLRGRVPVALVGTAGSLRIGCMVEGGEPGCGSSNPGREPPHRGRGCRARPRWRKGWGARPGPASAGSRRTLLASRSTSRWQVRRRGRVQVVVRPRRDVGGRRLAARLRHRDCPPGSWACRNPRARRRRARRARVTELHGEGTALHTVCRIVVVEDQLG
jgi:hypothetical protein